MILLDGKKISEEILNEISNEVQCLLKKGLRPPHLATVLVGNNPASQTYVNSKINHCKKVGFQSTSLHLEENISEEKLLDTIDNLNKNKELDGFIVQLPLPEHIDTNKIIQAIDPNKDVDGFHPLNMGKLVLGIPTFVAATPLGILEILKRYNIKTEGKKCAVIGRSNIVGTPISILLSKNHYPGNCTVTICHSKSKNLKEITSESDILIVAMGKPEFITADMVKEGAVVIDVGIHRMEDQSQKKGYKIVGDVKFDEVAPKASYITPVPGGVGLLTICSLLSNTLKARLKNLES
jgi:methylenetetrahydrofolate dehydrogenase (NADP+)/methenyltetrahydrofolate cyclohydrolase